MISIIFLYIYIYNHTQSFNFHSYDDNSFGPRLSQSRSFTASFHVAKATGIDERVSEINAKCKTFFQAGDWDPPVYVMLQDLNRNMNGFDVVIKLKQSCITYICFLYSLLVWFKLYWSIKLVASKSKLVQCSKTILQYCSVMLVLIHQTFVPQTAFVCSPATWFVVQSALATGP